MNIEKSYLEKGCYVKYMGNQLFADEIGQSILEFSLIVAVLILVIIFTIPSLRESVKNVFVKTGNYLNNTSINSPNTAETPLTPLGSTLPEISGSMIDKINAYYLANGRYPRTWEPYSYTDLGLDPTEWSGKAYNGVIYKPGGSQVAIVPGENYGFRIKDMEGNTINLPYSYHWGLIYSIPNSNTWHFKRNDGTIVNIDTLEVYKINP